MHFYNRTFENTYLKLISEQTEEGVQFKYICKDCNTGFAQDDGFSEGDACPCEDCEGKLEECKIDDLDANNMPTAYQANAQDEDAQDDDLCDMQDEDQDLQDDDLCDAQDEDQDLQDDDLCDAQDEDQDLQDEDQDLQDDDLQDEDQDFQDQDDQAAAEDDTEEQGEQNEQGEQQPEMKLVSFTTADPALVELLTQVQNGEIKLVAVPVDFTFDEEEMNQQPQITSDTVGNFAIDDMDEEQDEQQDNQDEAEDNEDNEAETEESEIAKESKKKANVCCGVKSAKPSKYGIY